jgi:hypothetical protein
MGKQTTNTVLMIEPVAFGFNAQTAVNNYFQTNIKKDAADVQTLALREFQELVNKLRENGVEVIVVKDTPDPHTPDSVFPNNWISFHAENRVALYPMFAINRRLERRKEIVGAVAQNKLVNFAVQDYSSHELSGRFLEGTGSMVLDRKNKIAYAALSERTDKGLFLSFCNDFDYKPVCFGAFQTVDNLRLPVYHTNVMMCVADEYVVICSESIDNESERNRVKKMIDDTGKETIEISEKQMQAFAGNMLQLENEQGLKLLVMSRSAFASLEPEKLVQLLKYNNLVVSDVGTIEKYGGGSVRCMLCEVFTNE